MYNIIKKVLEYEKPKLHSVVEDMENRGIILNSWQLVDFSGCNRRIGKTYVSYCKVMYAHCDGMVVTPKYDIDIDNSANRKTQWLKGFLDFIDEYYPEYTYKVTKHKYEVQLFLKNDSSLIISKLEEIISYIKGKK
jgi:hypothetical protein